MRVHRRRRRVRIRSKEWIRRKFKERVSKGKRSMRGRGRKETRKYVFDEMDMF